jgi:hypothetical protein
MADIEEFTAVAIQFNAPNKKQVARSIRMDFPCRFLKERYH